MLFLRVMALTDNITNENALRQYDFWATDFSEYVMVLD
jgi:hypothetical protein